MYPHYARLPYAREPWKTLYVIQRSLTTLALIPYWFLKYAFLPRRYRPRPSWSIVQILTVNSIRRIHRVAEVAGVTWGTRDPQAAPDERYLKRTRFQWIEPLPSHLRTGIVVGNAPFCQVGAYIYPKAISEKIQVAKISNKSNPDPNGLIMIGLFMHGGGYCHMSAHESSGPSIVPKRLIEDGIFDEIFSVEYRLLQHAQFPGALQDAAAAYVHIVENYQDIENRVVLIGDSSGGNLALALARWIRDEGVLRMPDGLLLLSPSCDPSNALPETLPSRFRKTRPNDQTDYIADTPEFRALLLRTFLGFRSHPEEALPEEVRKLTNIAHSEYVSPCSPIVLKKWGHEVTQDKMYDNNDMGSGDDENTIPDNMKCGSSKFPSLFYGFPKTLVIAGDAERLTWEIENVVRAMKKDGIDIEAKWIPDAVHDVLIMSEWDKKAAGSYWTDIANWARQLSSRQLRSQDQAPPSASDGCMMHV